MERLGNLGFDCHEEVYAVNSDGTTRFANIVAFHRDKRRAFILDLKPTGTGNLRFGSRGVIPKTTSEFLLSLGIEKSDLNELVKQIIIDSLAILNFHIYN
ncbi:hypothetical protein O3M35_005791 [Rhynocoris fuscipes]|uniref:Uncharacterized protein n=1 Tax=Rhynocoris fuscipes TaxID=488301 RepID=A0AAW1DN90_9HEMI